jgi:hypothetical protein
MQSIMKWKLEKRLMSLTKRRTSFANHQKENINNLPLANVIVLEDSTALSFIFKRQYA